MNAEQVIDRLIAEELDAHTTPDMNWVLRGAFDNEFCKASLDQSELFELDEPDELSLRARKTWPRR